MLLVTVTCNYTLYLCVGMYVRTYVPYVCTTLLFFKSIVLQYHKLLWVRKLIWEVSSGCQLMHGAAVVPTAPMRSVGGDLSLLITCAYVDSKETTHDPLTAVQVKVSCCFS